MRYILLFLFALSIYSVEAQQLSVFFDSGKSTLSENGKHRLDSLIGTFETELIYDIKLVGHTDSIGSLEGNKWLSKQRAESVYKYFPKKRNVRFTSITGKAYTVPIRTNSTDEGRALNRRCDIFVTVSKVKSERWLMPAQSFNIKNADSSILYTKNGCKIYVSPGSFKLKDGDSINIQVTEYNTPAEFIAGGLPMSFSKDGKPYMYESEQMMKIEAFVNGAPVQLMKLLGMQCPNVDTSNNVKFYEFSGRSSTHVNVINEIELGRVDVVTKPVVVHPVIVPGANTPQTIVKSKEKAEKTYAFDYSGKTKPIKNSKANQLPKAKVEKKKDEKAINKKQDQDVIELKKDTGRVRLEPDTSKNFILEPDTVGLYLGGGGGNGGSPDYYCAIIGLHYEQLNICAPHYVLREIDFGLQYENKQFFKPELIDFNEYFARYKDLSYDGMELKCEKAQEKLYSVHIKFKRRSKSRISLLFTSFVNNPEYEPLKKIKWIIDSPIENNNVNMLMKSKISDFRIFPGDYSLANPKETNYIEIKTDSAFYRFSVKANKRLKGRKRYLEYEDLFKNKVVAFNDSIEKYVKDNNIFELYCLYEVTERFSANRTIASCNSHRTVSGCFIFEYFKSDVYLKNLEECHSHSYCFNTMRDFLSWLKFYNSNMSLFQKELIALKKNVNQVIDCECMDHSVPCKWEYYGGSSEGNNIISIGLGEYNFDREMALEDQIRIDDAIYLNEQGDTLFKCSVKRIDGHIQKICNHTTYTIIPGFNGLLKQNDPGVLQLLPGKKNILYFENHGRKYKLYIDLTNADSYTGNIFRLKEITEEASTLDGLIKVLEITD